MGHPWSSPSAHPTFTWVEDLPRHRRFPSLVQSRVEPDNQCVSPTQEGDRVPVGALVSGYPHDTTRPRDTGTTPNATPLGSPLTTLTLTAEERLRDGRREVPTPTVETGPTGLCDPGFLTGHRTRTHHPSPRPSEWTTTTPVKQGTPETWTFYSYHRRTGNVP